MPLGRITFNLSDPDDRNEHRMALDGWKYKGVLWEIEEYIRLRMDANLSKTARAELELLKKLFYEELADRGIELHE